MGVTQVKSGNANPTADVTLDAAVASGVTVWVITDNQAAANPTISDNQGNTYSDVIAPDDVFGGARIGIKKCTTTASGTFTVSVGNGTFCRVHVIELSDAFEVDDQSLAEGIFSEPAGTGVVAAANGMAMGVAKYSTGTQTPDAGWSELLDNNGLIASDRDTVASSTYTMGLDTSSFDWAVWTFVLSAGGGPPTYFSGNVKTMSRRVRHAVGRR